MMSGDASVDSQTRGGPKSSLGAGHRQDIDGLRALAVVPVVLFHMGLPGVSGGFVGVDIFFVISGFLITGILLGDLNGARFSIAGFYERRVRRIFPALFAVLAFTTVVAAVLMVPADLTAYGRSLAGTALFVSNFVFSGENGYFAAISEETPLLHTWSLAVEEQFYIGWPILLWLLHRYARRFLVPVTILITVASFVVCVWMTDRAPSQAFFLPPARVWELMLGALLALWPLELKARWLRQTLSIAGLVMIIASVVLFSEADAFPGWRAAVPCLGAAFCLAANRRGDTIGATLLSYRPVVFVGLVSYSLYLWHWPLLAFARYRLMEPPPLPLALLLGAAAFGLAVLSWRYVERPFRRRGQGTAGRNRTLITATVVTLAFVAAGLTLTFTRGLPGRMSDGVRAAEAAAHDNPVFPAACGPRSALNCGFPGSGNGVVVLWGDSHSWAFSPIAARAAEQAGLRLKVYSRQSCPPFAGVQVWFRTNRDKTCEAYTRKVMADLKADPNVKVVIISARWGLWSETMMPGGDDPARFYVTDGRDSTLTVANSRRVFAAALRDTVARIREAAGPDVRIILVEPVPEMPFSAPDCFARMRHWGLPDTRCAGAPRAPIEARQAFALEQLRAVAASVPGVSTYAIAKSLCDARSCVTIRDGVILYRDDDHLNVGGGKLAAPDFSVAPQPSETGQ